MSALKSEFLRTFVERGYLAQATDLDSLDEAASAGPVVGYIGFDATAPSLHVGSLVQIMLLRRLQQTGHKPIVLLGGGTTRLGDPTGRDEARQLLTPEQIGENAAGIRKVFDKFVRFGDGPTDAVLVDNADWLLELKYVDFLREYGRHFSVNRMLTFDSVKLRLEREQALSFLEFNYMILQAYDFVELSRRFGCRLQMGGSDQWGNIVSGIELGRRMDTPPLFGLTTPLMTTASGAKMGKTAKGAVWLNPDMLSPYDYWQFWRNTEDQDVGRFLRLFTDMPLGEIARLEALEGRELNDAKKILASETTRMAHGAEAAEAAAETARRTFEEGALADGLPTVELPRERLAGGIGILALFTEAGLTASNSEARRFVKDGGLKVNDEIVRDETRQVGLDALTGDGVIKLSLGKKKHVLVRPA